MIVRPNSDVRKLVLDPELRARLVDQGFQPAGWSVEESESFVSGEVARWGKLVREAKIQPD